MNVTIVPQEKRVLFILKTIQLIQHFQIQHSLTLTVFGYTGSTGSE